MLLSEGCQAKYSEELMQIIKSRQATLISTTYCGYCTKAKRLLQQNDIQYNEIMLDRLSGDD